MTALQKQFCEEYVKDYNGRQAYLRIKPDMDAHIAENSAYKLLKKPEIREYIKELQLEAIREYGDISNLLIKELVADVVARDSNGAHTTSWSKSADLIQKQLGLQKQSIKADVDNKVEFNITLEEEK